jgi:glycosyltransferase involved in cell wall biosynthesis
MKRALVMCLADASMNPRPNRIMRLLHEHGWEVDYFGHHLKQSFDVPLRKRHELPPFQSVKSGKFLRRIIGVCAMIEARLGRFGPWNAMRLQKIIRSPEGIESALRDDERQLVIVENLELLPLSFRIKGNARILFDAREYFPGEFERNLMWRTFVKPIQSMLLKRYLHQCDHRITVSDAIKDLYERQYDASFVTVRSTPKFVDATPEPTRNGTIRLVYHGAALPDRRLDNLIAITERLDDKFSLDMYLVGDEREIERLRALAKRSGRVRVKEPVGFQGIIPMLRQYDIGMVYYEPHSKNIEGALPNKLFEYIQARLAVFAGPSTEISKIVRDFDCGFTSRALTIDSCVEVLKSLSSDDVDRAKMNADQAARVLCWENESQKVLNLIGGHKEPQGEG